MNLKGDNLVIRVGGGYMSISEFIEQHNPIAKNMRQEQGSHPFHKQNLSLNNLH